MKPAVLCLAVCIGLFVPHPDESPLTRLVKTSNVIVRGEMVQADGNIIISENGGFCTGGGRVRVTEVLKGRPELNGETISFSHVLRGDQVERGAAERPLFEEGREYIVFLIERAPLEGGGFTAADPWLAFQPPRVGLVRDIDRAVREDTPEPSDAAESR